VNFASAVIVDDLAPTGVLRASINLGNPVLVQGLPESPTGITVDIAREVASKLNVPVEFTCFDAARKSYEAMQANRADLCFLAVEPAREAGLAFTAPYVVIEGVFVVPQGSPLVTLADVDTAGVRIGVNSGSAYDLFLSRTLQHASIVRAEDGVQEFISRGLEAAAGVRQPMAEFVSTHPGVRLIDTRFMQIQQAVATQKTRRPEAIQFLRDIVETLKASGFIADALRRSHQLDAVVAAPG
jgi:polar amino acid transport system substrate-binding protein